MLWCAVVCSDPLKGEEAQRHAAFGSSSRKAATALAGDSWGKESLSGNERNRLFLNQSGKQFSDASLLSGLDHPGDGRSVVILDYDRDGWPDIASVNSNAPKLNLYRNRIGDRATPGRTFIALRFEGGGEGLSNRDGVGTKVWIEIGDRTLLRETHCGEGFAAQNSTTLLVGLGNAKEITSLRARWPSGREQTHGKLPAGQVVTLVENPDEGETSLRLGAYSTAKPPR